MEIKPFPQTLRGEKTHSCDIQMNYAKELVQILISFVSGCIILEFIFSNHPQHLIYWQDGAGQQF